MKTYLKTTETGATDDYPYGRLKCRATFKVEFNPKRGFRSVFQTINPKTQRQNAPKKGTYSPIMVVLKNDDGQFKFLTKLFHGFQSINVHSAWMATNFYLFTPEEIKYIYFHVVCVIRAEAKGMCDYCGANADGVIDVVGATVKILVNAIKSGKNVFDQIKIDIEALEALKVPDFNPFTITEYKMIGAS
jgi:hypothetical protein